MNTTETTVATTVDLRAPRRVSPHAAPTVGKQAPHPRGYRPDLPLSSSDASVMAWAKGVEENTEDEP